jgi:hypothetical protein
MSFNGLLRHDNRTQGVIRHFSSLSEQTSGRQHLPDHAAAVVNCLIAPVGAICTWTSQGRAK